MESSSFSTFLALFFLVNSLVHFIATFTVFDKAVGVDAKLKLVFLYFLGASAALVLMVFYANQSNWLSNSLGLVVMSLSLWLFLMTSKVHKRIKLTPIYSTNTPQHLVTDGPYGKIRHPFYTAYLLNYFGVALASANIWAFLIVVSLVIIYRQAALQEENKFSQSELHGEYQAYRNRAGLFLPKIT